MVALRIFSSSGAQNFRAVGRSKMAVRKAGKAEDMRTEGEFLKMFCGGANMWTLREGGRSVKS